MTYKEYLKEHFEFIKEWHFLRDLKIPDECDTPAVGVTAYHTSTPVCIAFLRQVEGGYAQIDGLITNPKVAAHLRNKALDGVLLYLIEKARSLNIKGICSYSEDPHSIERAKRLGFTALSHTVLGIIPQKINNA